MKNTILKTIGTMTLAMLMLAAFTQISVSAQDIITEEKSDEQTEDLSARLANTKGLEGSWNVQVTGRNCQTGAAIRTFPSMLTFMRGGTMVEWGSATVPSTRGSGQGVWSNQFDLSYSSSFQFFRFNADGTLAGRQIVRQQIVLNPFDGSFTSTAIAQILDAGGNVIATNCSTGIGTRFE